MKTRALASLMALVGGYACALPEQPAIDRDVHMTENRQYLNPTIPTLVTSADGRVGISHRIELVNGGGNIAFRLQVPEKIEQPFLESPAGTFILSYPNALAPDEAGLNPTGTNQEVGGSNSSHAGLCDPSSAPDSTIRNPRACGADDCYDLVIVRAEDVGNPSWQLTGTPVEVRVANPKTPEARIVDVTAGDVVRGSTFGFLQFFEPVITSDGRLMTARVGANGQFSWNDNSGARRTSTSDMVYFVNDNPDNPTLNNESLGACDVRQWDQIRPMAHAPYDDTINTRYGFAMQPFRDPNGEVLHEYQSMGTYPWIDRDGDNITFTNIGTDLIGNRDYQSRCPQDVGNCANESTSETNGLLQGRVMMGLWTRGKMVLLDNMVNNIDFGLASLDRTHREVRLYEANGSYDGYTRVGNGRENVHDNMPLSSSGNSTFFDSNEHRFNYLENMRPITPADVTWLASSGRSTDEIPLDDYMNPNSFINANMVQVVTFRKNNNGSWNWQDERRITQNGRVQNAATATNDSWVIPTHGAILGDGRVEPIAKGGIHGKGYWLDGAGSGLSFDIPAQPSDILDSPWYYGIFVDTRNVTGERSLISFPDGSEIRINGTNQIRYYNAVGTLVRTITSSQTFSEGAWAHLGVQMSNRNRTIQTYVNGYRIDEFNHNSALFQVTPGALVVGVSQTNGVSDYTGWIDDFKVFAETVNVEVACNHAGGTLAGVTNNAPSQWTNLANNLPTASHTRITNELAENGELTYNQYACYHDYSDDYAAHLANIPSGMVGIRDAINFPEGPIFRDRPRPDSSQNAFCLSCHTADGNDGMSIAALTLNASVNAPDDHRRQPMQPDPLVYGHIPANWLGQGRPANAFIADAHGYQIDNLVLGLSDGSEPPIEDPQTPVEPPVDEPQEPEDPQTPVEPPVEDPQEPSDPDTTPEDPSTPSDEPQVPAGQTLNLATADTYTAASDNWDANRLINIHDDDWVVEARATSQGTTDLVWVEYQFPRVNNLSFAVREDNAPSFQISRWKVQSWHANNSIWVDVMDWQTATVNGWTDFTPNANIEVERIRVLFEAPNGQNVGMREFDATGITVGSTSNPGSEPTEQEPSDPAPSEPEQPAPAEPEPEPSEPQTPAGETIELATAVTFSSASANWQSDRLANVFDDDLVVEARANSQGVYSENESDLVWVEFTFVAVNNLTFSLREDNAPSYQTSRWKVQRWDQTSSDWIDVMDWQNANVNGWTHFTPSAAISTNRIRVLAEAPNGQQVGIREFDATGTAI
ncbi:hypothetical protein C2869_00435 [Saccharobesus litoralis]|uniref:Concanavalin A-like lectin/glucanases superfamily protein n=1 Tax=Saccharobesus litoralis TaxID=2172099 RepID=A0A2S0VLB5_9ALTE|nr:hypothetical protein [Saccharobesus litoralis]AWB64998.1 hypothetical protein C2869_00435 [Saccharobesus litoralis]